MKKELIVPEFKNEDEEFEFWSNLDLSEYIEPEDLESVEFPNLKPTDPAVLAKLGEEVEERK